MTKLHFCQAALAWPEHALDAVGLVMQSGLEIFIIFVGLVASAVGVVPALLTLGLLPMYIFGLPLQDEAEGAFDEKDEAAFRVLIGIFSSPFRDNTFHRDDHRDVGVICCGY